MEITIKIQAPEVAAAIHALAKALEVNTQGNLSAKNALASTITVLADVLESNGKALGVEQVAATSPAAVPTAQQTYSMDQLAVAATQLVDAGRRTELVSLLNSFGVQALTALSKEQYGAFATQLRAMGAKI